jgi:hypothetical protein
MKKSFSKGLLLVGLSFFFVNKLVSQGIGPQVLPLVPEDMVIVNAFYLNLQSNTTPSGDIISKNANLKLDIVTSPIIYSFSIKNKLARVIVLPTYNWLNGSIDLNDQNFDVLSRDGFGDTEVIFMMGLLNTPSLNLAEYSEWQPKFQLNAMIGFGIPTGQYDETQVVNIGSNRWAFRISTPMVVPLNANKEKLAQWEINPSAFFYTQNNDNFWNTTKSQSPMFFLEQHVSKYFTKDFWLSLDINYQYGGRTKINDFENNDLINQFGTGATVGYSVIDGLTIMASYGKVWFSEDNGRMFRGGMSLTIPSKKDREALKALQLQNN